MNRPRLCQDYAFEFGYNIFINAETHQRHRESSIAKGRQEDRQMVSATGRQVVDNRQTGQRLRPKGGDKLETLGKQ